MYAKSSEPPEVTEPPEMPNVRFGTINNPPESIVNVCPAVIVTVAFTVGLNRNAFTVPLVVSVEAVAVMFRFNVPSMAPFNAVAE